MDLLSTDENVDDELHIQERDAQINIFLSKLNEREQRVLILHFGLQGSEVYSLEEISKEIGLTRERVRQIESKAIRKLRAMKDIILAYVPLLLPFHSIIEKSHAAENHIFPEVFKHYLILDL